jgi:hypothetical protein
LPEMSSPKTSPTNSPRSTTRTQFDFVAPDAKADKPPTDTQSQVGVPARAKLPATLTTSKLRASGPGKLTIPESKSPQAIPVSEQGGDATVGSGSDAMAGMHRSPSGSAIAPKSPGKLNRMAAFFTRDGSKSVGNEKRGSMASTASSDGEGPPRSGFLSRPRGSANAPTSRESSPATPQGSPRAFQHNAALDAALVGADDPKQAFFNELPAGVQTDFQFVDRCTRLKTETSIGARATLAQLIFDDHLRVIPPAPFPPSLPAGRERKDVAAIVQPMLEGALKTGLPMDSDAMQLMTTELRDHSYGVVSQGLQNKEKAETKSGGLMRRLTKNLTLRRPSAAAPETKTTPTATAAETSTGAATVSSPHVKNRLSAQSLGLALSTPAAYATLVQDAARAKVYPELALVKFYGDIEAAPTNQAKHKILGDLFNECVGTSGPPYANIRADKLFGVGMTVDELRAKWNAIKDNPNADCSELIAAFAPARDDCRRTLLGTPM